MLDALVFWLLAFAVGLIGLPFAAILFERLPGGGLALARPLGLLVVAYPLWLLASLHAVDYGRAAAALTTALVAGVSLLIGLPVLRGRPRRSISIRLWLVGECVFSVCFAGWALLRSFSPDVLQTEKPMDMAIVNAINKSGSFPPHDPWFAGDAPQLLLLRPLRQRVPDPPDRDRPGGRVQPRRRTLLRPLGDGGLCRRFRPLSRLAQAGARSRRRGRRSRPGSRGIRGCGQPRRRGRLSRPPGPVRHFNWFGPSRVIPNTANEFPFFSFLLGDLHAHVLAPPFALIALAYAMQICLAGPGASSEDKPAHTPSLSASSSSPRSSSARSTRSTASTTRRRSSIASARACSSGSSPNRVPG